MINYKDTIISQYANSPKILAVIETFNDAVDPSADIDNIFNKILNIETSSGFGLDILGRVVGVGRFVKLPAAQPYFGFSEGA